MKSVIRETHMTANPSRRQTRWFAAWHFCAIPHSTRRWNCSSLCILGDKKEQRRWWGRGGTKEGKTNPAALWRRAQTRDQQFVVSAVKQSNYKYININIYVWYTFAFDPMNESEFKRLEMANNVHETSPPLMTVFRVQGLWFEVFQPFPAKCGWVTLGQGRLQEQ